MKIWYELFGYVKDLLIVQSGSFHKVWQHLACRRILQIRSPVEVQFVHYLWPSCIGVVPQSGSIPLAWSMSRSDWHSSTTHLTTGPLWNINNPSEYSNWFGHLLNEGSPFQLNEGGQNCTFKSWTQKILSFWNFQIYFLHLNLDIGLTKVSPSSQEDSEIGLEFLRGL